MIGLMIVITVDIAIGGKTETPAEGDKTGLDTLSETAVNKSTVRKSLHTTSTTQGIIRLPALIHHHVLKLHITR